MSDFVSTDKYLDIQFKDFFSKLDILMYYVAVSSYMSVTDRDCKRFVSIIAIH